MELRWSLTWVTFATYLVLINALPASIIENIKASELRENKAKRSPHLAHTESTNQEEVDRSNTGFYNKPSAAKREPSDLKNPRPDQLSLEEWEQVQQMYRPQKGQGSADPDRLIDSLDNIQSTLYNSGESPYDDKSIAEYEKGFHYGTNKEKLDEALENAVLKSELYGERAAMNQYRYYGMDERRRRKRRNVRKLRLDTRNKRDIELTPEEILTILTLYENERQPNSYRNSWQRFEQSLDQDSYDKDDNEIDQDDESWLDAPVYPHSIGRGNDIGQNYYYDEPPKLYEKRGRWGGFADRNKRFMVAKKRNDPTRELRYLNGPNKNDYYTLSELLSNDNRDPNVPLYHRLIL